MGNQFITKSYKSTKKGYRTIGGKRYFFKSAWEANVARVLQKLRESGAISDWLYEDKIFWFENIKRGVRSYVPDFRVIYPNGSEVFTEVKGYWDNRSKTKIKRMAKYYPEVSINIIGASEYKEISSHWKATIGDDWE